VSIISSLKDIDQAIAELNYRSETTLKYKLIHAIRNWYTSEGSLEALQAIDPEDLVKSIWETGDNPELVRNKKKNFSSLKSGVNTDLKKLYTRGKNPQGIIINHSNVLISPMRQRTRHWQVLPMSCAKRESTPAAE